MLFLYQVEVCPCPSQIHQGVISNHIDLQPVATQATLRQVMAVEVAHTQDTHHHHHHQHHQQEVILTQARPNHLILDQGQDIDLKQLLRHVSSWIKVLHLANLRKT